MKNVAYSILKEIKETAQQLDERALFLFAQELQDANRIFLCGTGRCDLIIRSFAMRLMHLSLSCHVVRDVTTPAIQKDDLLVLCTLNPDNKGLVDIAKKAYLKHAHVALLSPQSESPIGDLAKVNVLVPKTLTQSGLPSMQSGGVVFEQCCFVVFETLILHLTGRLNRSNETLLQNRANLE